MSTSTPHDALFKFAFGQTEHAASLLASVLPQALATRIDWHSLQNVPISFVDEELSDRYADLLFTVKIDSHEALLYVLCEHQSSTDIWMPLRMLEYCARIWQHWRRDHKDAKALPAIVPVVLHHGDRQWSASTRFVDLICLDTDAKTALAPYLIDFRFLLDDLTQQSDAQLRGRALTEFAQVVALCWKHLPYDADPISVLENLLPLLARLLAAPSGLAALTAILNYATQVSEFDVAQLRTRVASKLGSTAEQAIMTTAERLRQEGEARGRAEGETRGRAEGRAAVLLKQLTLKFGPLPDAVVERVHSATIPELELWAERILSAKTLDDTLA